MHGMRPSINKTNKQTATKARGHQVHEVHEDFSLNKRPPAAGVALTDQFVEVTTLGSNLLC